MLYQSNAFTGYPYEWTDQARDDCAVISTTTQATIKELLGKGYTFPEISSLLFDAVHEAMLLVKFELQDEYVQKANNQ